ncbi:MULTISPECIES: hypothetical protein [Halorussus]|uniref:hypothetical protein n=1 Tax=Halorussus TaxID=1070314 RepID=UPI00209EE697|nr:hypothetical protein [Halorussus vallis]USZ78634.1 hypothetical protein NGM07_25125 [Halorussus vallis]USZ78665.1 hypothetical protein NGM07_24455 [Halorussus vallis]
MNLDRIQRRNGMNRLGMHVLLLLAVSIIVWLGITTRAWPVFDAGQFIYEHIQIVPPEFEDGLAQVLLVDVVFVFVELGFYLGGDA